MSGLKEEKWISEEEYWAGETLSPIKHEWFNGRVRPLFRESEEAGNPQIHAELVARLNRLSTGTAKIQKNQWI